MSTEQLFLLWNSFTTLTFFAVILGTTRRLAPSVSGAIGLEVLMLLLTYGGLSALPYTRLPWLQYLNWFLVFAWCLFALLAHLRPGRNRASEIPLYATFLAAALFFLIHLLPMQVVRALMRLTLLASLLWWLRHRKG